MESGQKEAISLDMLEGKLFKRPKSPDYRMEHKNIVIRGAREHNLKNISVEIAIKTRLCLKKKYEDLPIGQRSSMKRH